MTRRDALAVASTSAVGLVLPSVASAASMPSMKMRLTLDHLIVENCDVVLDPVSWAVQVQAWDGVNSLVNLGDFVQTGAYLRNQGNSLILFGPGPSKSFDFTFDFAGPRKLLLLSTWIDFPEGRRQYFRRTLNRGHFVDGATTQEFGWTTVAGGTNTAEFSGHFSITLFDRSGLSSVSTG